MKVGDLMNKTSKFCTPATNLAEVAELLWSLDCGALPVVDGPGQVVGMITDRDICIGLGTRDRLASEMTVAEVINGPVYSCRVQDDIQTALKTLRTQKVRRLPVLNKEGKLEGMLCLNDLILHAEKRSGQKIPALSYEDVIETLKVISEHRFPQAAAA